MRFRQILWLRSQERPSHSNLCELGCNLIQILTRVALTAVILFFTFNLAFAQDPQYGYGILTGNTYVGEHENVNVGTGNMHIEIPLLKLSGRNGHDFVLSLDYNSQIWSGEAAINPQGYETDFWETPGWMQGSSGVSGDTSLHQGWSWNSGIGSAQLFSDWAQVGTSGSPPNQVSVYCYINYRVKWGDGHMVSYPGLQTNCQYNWPETHIAGAGSAATSVYCFTDRSVLQVPDSGPATLYLENGERPLSFEDSNGNLISTVDTLGRTVPTPPSLPASSSFNITYKDSNSNSQTIQLIYQNWNVKPNLPSFGSGTYAGYAKSVPAIWSMLTAVVLANGDRWDFRYDPDSSGYSYGELTKVTYPSGGYTTYQYATIGTAVGGCTGPGANSSCGVTYPKRQLVSKQVCRDPNTRANGGSCAGGLLDPPTTLTPNSTNTQNIIVDPLGNKTIFTLDGTYGMETQRQIYQGTTTLLRTVATTATCDGPTQQTVTLNDSVGTSLVSKTTWTRGTPITQYGSGLSQSANVTKIVEYDYAAAPGPVLRTTNYGWLQTNSVNGVNYTSIPVRMINRKMSETVLNGAGSTVAQATYEYDNYTYGGGIATSGAIQHDSTFGTGYTTRGNITKTSHWLNTNNTWLNTTNTYDDAGNVLSTKDPNGNVITFSYADNFADGVNRSTAAYLSQVTLPRTSGVSHITRKQFYYNSGLIAASCGDNFAGTCTNTASFPQPDYATYTYDVLGRPLVTTLGDGGKTTISYSDDQSSPPAQFSTTTGGLITSGGLSKTGIALQDGIGEIIQKQLTSDPDGTDYVDLSYDGLGHTSTVSNPHRSGGLPTDGTTSYNYDALGRTTNIVNPDGTTVTTAYAGNTATVTDEANKQRESVVDALGRLTSVWEDPGNSPHLNYETDYGLDALGNLLSVTQKGGTTNSSSWRVRTFTYDSLSHLVCAANPEVQPVTCPSSPTGPFPAGAVMYTYDGDSNVITKVAPSPNQTSTAYSVTTTYSYDALNRLTQKAYADTYASNPATLSVQYGYDGVALTGCTTTPPTLSDSYPKSRRTSICDGSGAASWTHDQIGRKLSETRTIAGITNSIGYSYNLDGSTATLTYPSGRVITYTPSAAGRMVSAVDSASSVNYVTGATYAPYGELSAFSSVKSGYTVSGALTYNSRLQPLQLYYTAGTISSTTISQLQQGTCPTTVASIMSRSYNFGLGTNDNGNVQAITNCRASGRSQTFVYDSLNRISQAYT